MSKKKVTGSAAEDPDITQYSANQSTDIVTRILRLLGNHSPSVKQRRLIKTLLFNISFKAELLFDKSLAPREQECLLFAALGCSSAQTAEILPIEKKTVEEFLSNTRKKLGCKNTTQAVVQGIRYGYISPEKYGQNPVKIRENKSLATQ
ncbi:autoinducer-binding domain protein [Candidatus Rickettsiella viridis]|uniref:Autoinducer-binding domain protein n=1 Tax=Candidatus Rickettsiella viridis TaxID=676208 RepID=A0A2Z5UTL4_9COXI|nr:helix-turn-helix transcriptional regulator [Candidatus Rickettsiella viridis]BBB14784.1 autoinducer-binding domain protein [Candidatus Rickettsiella viridis]BBB15514.1 autoinducer-binding domain protein [Candidatus Rickettsiella viridis]